MNALYAVGLIGNIMENYKGKAYRSLFDLATKSIVKQMLGCYIGVAEDELKK